MKPSLYFLSVLLIAFTARVDAQEATAESKPDAWQGTLDLGAAKLRLQFFLTPEKSGNWSGEMISVDQGGVAVPFDQVKIGDDGSIELSIKRLGFEYSGRFDEARQQMTGTMSQAGSKFPLTLKRFQPIADLKPSSTWQGTMQAGQRKFEFQVRLFNGDNGQLVGKLDSFSEKLTGLALDDVVLDKETFSFALPATAATYQGKLNAEKDEALGAWKQSGQSFELTFKKIDLAETKETEPLKRPQVPTEPYPYRSQVVEFDNTADQVHLSGTLTRPEERGHYPAVILITGSGPQDRDESLLGHKPFLILSDYLTRHGYAVLRYDERGVGKSTGDFAAADSRDLARDVEAAIEFLKKQPEIDDQKIVLIGHSEGGYIAPMIAARRKDVAAIVLMAGPGVPGKDIILNQSQLILSAEGVTAENMEVQNELQTAVLNAVTAATDVESARQAIEESTAGIIARLPEDQRKSVTLEQMVAPFQSPWFRFFLTYDPRPALRKVRCPVLVLNGSKDLQVDPKLNLPEIRKALKEGGNGDYEIVELAGLNHLFQTAITGAPSEYRTIEETMAPKAMETVVEFLNQRLR